MKSGGQAAVYHGEEIGNSQSQEITKQSQVQIENSSK